LEDNKKKYMKFIKNKKLILCFCVFVFLCFLFLSANVCFAADGQASIWKDMEECRKSGSCSLNDFVRLFANVSQWILGIVGSLALLMFIYGGLMFIISSGSSEKVTKAKEIIIGAVIGLVIVFTSYMIIQFTMDALGIEIKKGGWAVTSWFK